MAVISVSNLSSLIIIVILIIGTSSTEIKLLQSVFRHGDRYPLPFSTTKYFYPLNPYANVSWYPNSDGGLTKEGKNQSFELGKTLRARYGVWLRRYSGKAVKFFSSGSERATVTASLVAAGLFPPKNESPKLSSEWNPSLNWQPVPVTSMRYPENLLFYSGFFCSKYMANLEKTKLSDSTIIEYDTSMKKLYEFVAPNIGIPVDNRILYYLYLELLATVSCGLAVPKWAEEIFLNGSLKEAAIKEYKYSSWNNELKRMTGGIWIKKWLEHVDDYVDGNLMKNSSNIYKNKEKKKAFFYSGHDINIAGIMNTLDIFYPHIPNYGSAINFELHEDRNKKLYVKVAHRDSGKFIDYVIPGCDDILCPLNIFKNIFSKVLTVNPIEECGSFGFFSGNINTL